MTASAPDRVARFQAVLEKRKIEHTLRRSKGADIDAACGQLAVRGIQEAKQKAREERAQA
jgi:adenine C2-methylase RlmN of 23S rRNA A2503 and tRNA A37